MYEISKQIKTLRDSCNLSQERFGKKIGVSGKTISAYENGRATPSLKILNAISKTYNTNLFPAEHNSDVLIKIEQIEKYIFELKLILKSE